MWCRKQKASGILPSRINPWEELLPEPFQSDFILLFPYKVQNPYGGISFDWLFRETWRALGRMTLKGQHPVHSHAKSSLFTTGWSLGWSSSLKVIQSLPVPLCYDSYKTPCLSQQPVPLTLSSPSVPWLPLPSHPASFAITVWIIQSACKKSLTICSSLPSKLLAEHVICVLCWGIGTPREQDPHNSHPTRASILVRETAANYKMILTHIQ